MEAVWTVWCGHSFCDCSRHDKRLKYHLTVNHKTKSIASHRHSVQWKCLNISQKPFNIYTFSTETRCVKYMSVYWAAGDIIGRWTKFTNWKAVSLFDSYRTVLHKPLVTMKGAIQSVCRPSMNSGLTLYNNTLYAISTERLRKYKAFN